MKQKILLIFFSFCLQLSYSQNKPVDGYSAIDKKALQLSDTQTKSTDLIASYIIKNFKTEKEKARAIFIWISTNIRYDIDNMYNIRYNEDDLIKISRTLLTRKGVCENYSALFIDICAKVGLKSFQISGYTKQNGVVANLTHAWCAARIDGNWYLFDPTWGSGYLSNGKYVRKIDDAYFMAKPSSMIGSHMPFDYLWQFLNYPITHQEFIDGKISSGKSRPYFSFKDSIQAYENQDEIGRLISSADRIEKSGVRNVHVFNRFREIKQQIETVRHNEIVAIYNSAVSDCNEGVNSLNAFINFRNKQFTPQKTDLEIRSMIDIAFELLNKSKLKIDQIQSDDLEMSNLVQSLRRSIEDTLSQLKDQQNWLSEYLKKGKPGRKAMFVGKVTWYGIPLN